MHNGLGTITTNRQGPNKGKVRTKKEQLDDNSRGGKKGGSVHSTHDDLADCHGLTRHSNGTDLVAQLPLGKYKRVDGSAAQGQVYLGVVKDKAAGMALLTAADEYALHKRATTTIIKQRFLAKIDAALGR